MYIKLLLQKYFTPSQQLCFVPIVLKLLNGIGIVICRFLPKSVSFFQIVGHFASDPDLCDHFRGTRDMIAEGSPKW